jgi:cell division protein FtsX
MIALVKALLPGIFLSWIVSTFVGSRGSSGGLLHIQHFDIAGHHFLGSWTLFIIGTALGWAIFKMMD